MSDVIEQDQSLGIEDVQDQPEEIHAVQSADYTSFGPTMPGKYLNDAGQREIIHTGSGTATLNDELLKRTGAKGRVVTYQKYEVRIKGLIDPATGRTFKRPDRHWIDTRPSLDPIRGERGQYHPGFTSSLAKYLTSCGFGKAELNSITDAAVRDSLITASVDRPVMVVTGLRPKGKKTGQTRANGKEFYRTPGNPAPDVYEGKKLYTSAFKTADGKYATTAKDENGEEWQAQESVEWFARVGA